MRTRLQISMVVSFLMTCGSLSLQALPVNLISNGSFETPVVPVGGFINYLAGSTAITGWTVVGPEASIVSGSYAPNVTFPAEDGVQWLDLTGDVSNTTEGVQQTVATIPGTVYNLSFWVGNVDNPSLGWGTTSTVLVRLGGIAGTLIDTATNSSTNSTTQIWQQFNTSFTATGTSTTLDFINADPASDNTNGLDNVVLTAGGTMTGVPEPGTLSLLGAGIIGLGLAGRRRKIQRRSMCS